MATNLSGPIKQSSNTQPAASGVSPASSNDGKYTWSVVGQSTDGSILVFKAVGSGTITSGTTSGNTLTATLTTAPANTSSYIQVTAAYTSPNDKNNWTVKVSGGAGTMPQTFKKGTGGGM